MTVTDGLILLASVAGIGGLVVSGEVLRRVGVPLGATRRLVHASVAVFVVAAPRLFSGPIALYLLAGLFVGVNGVARAGGWWPSLHATRPTSWGTVALPAAVLPALAATWSVSAVRLTYFQAAFLVVGLADPLAGWVGQRLRSRQITKSATVAGVAVFTGATFVLLTTLLLATGRPAAWTLGVSVMVALFAASVEAISGNGWDNLTVVIAILALLVPLSEGTVTLLEMAGTFAVGVCFSGLAWKASVLDRSGAVAGGLFAASLVGLGGWPWILPGLAFFVLSSALTFLPVRSGSATGSSETRTLRQVLANGGVAWVLLLVAVFAPENASTLRAGCYLGFLGALSAAAADTWATEIGTRYAERPVHLAGWCRVAKGTSGAVSIAGTLAAAVGATTVGGAAYVVGGPSNFSAVSVGVVLLAGVAGMILDSLAGATIQGTESRPRRGTTDECGGRKEIGSGTGWKWLDNDGVNLLCTFTGALVSVLFWVL